MRMPWVTATDMCSESCQQRGLGATGKERAMPATGGARRGGALEAVKKYITRPGFEKLREQFHRLLYEDRPRVTREEQVAAAHGDRRENYEYKLGKKKMRAIDSKIHKLKKHLRSYDQNDPTQIPRPER